MMRGKRSGLALIIILAIAGVRACLYAFVIIPPWQAPDEPGHYLYARELADHGWRPLTHAERAGLQETVAVSLRAERFWKLLRRPWTEGRQRLYFALVQREMSSAGGGVASDGRLAGAVSAMYLRSQREDEPPLYYLAPAGLLHLASDIVSQLYLARGWSVLLFMVSAAFVYWGLRELAPGDGFVVLVGAALAILSPMPAFIGGACNNDVAAVASASAALWLMLRGARRGWTGRRVGALLALLVLATLTKKTTVFLWPLALAALAPAIWPKVRRAWRSLALVGAGLLAAGLTAGLWPTGAASGWKNPATYRLAARTDVNVYAGRFALILPAPARGQVIQAQQELAYNRVVRLRGQELELSFWARSEGAGGRGFAAIYDGRSIQRVNFSLAEDAWQRVTLPYRVDDDAKSLGVVLNNVSSQRLLFDEISWRDGAGAELLENGGIERGARWGETWLVRRRVLSPGLWPHLFDAASYTPASWLRYTLYGALTLAGAWANFGWLTLPLAPIWYMLVAAIYALAAAGLCRAGVRRWRYLEPRQRGLWGLAGLAVCFIVLQTCLPMIGSGWQPQGRYLFPALLPAVALLARGWREWAPWQGRSLWAIYLIIAMFVFEQVCIWGYLIPHYRGWA